jgi:hypothetical protein
MLRLAKQRIMLSLATRGIMLSLSKPGIILNSQPGSRTLTWHRAEPVKASSHAELVEARPRNDLVRPSRKPAVPTVPPLVHSHQREES